MKTTIEKRWGTHPDDVKHYDTERLRKEFLIEKVFSPDTIHMTDNNRARFGFSSRSELVDTALREYIGQRLIKESGQQDSQIERGDIKNLEDHLARLSYKIAVEIAQMNLLMASAFVLDEDTVHSLRGKAVRLLKKTRGFVPLSVANKNRMDLTVDTELNIEYAEPDEVYQTQVGDTLFSVTCDSPTGVDDAVMNKILRYIAYITVNSKDNR